MAKELLKLLALVLAYGAASVPSYLMECSYA